jgi:hypothetical protein
MPSLIVARLTYGFRAVYLKELSIATLLVVTRGDMGNKDDEEQATDVDQEDN